jgi:hypothetical protein
VSADFDPILDLVAAALRPAAGTLPAEPSDEELAVLRSAVAQRFPSTGRRAGGIRRRFPTTIGAMAAAALISTASVAAAATSVGEPVRVAQSFAYEIGLPVTDPNLTDARATLRRLIDALQRHDGAGVAGHLKQLRTELGRLDFGERSTLMRQIATKTPGIAAQLTNGPPPDGDVGAASWWASSTSTTQAGQSKRSGRKLPADRDRTPPHQKTLPTDPSTTVPPDTTTEPSTTVPPDTTTPTDPSTTVPPDTTTPTDPSTTVPPDTTTPTDPGTTVPPDTTPTTNPQPPPGTTTSLPG